MTAWLNTLLEGLLTGGLYALFAAGLSLSFGIMRLINIAHGDFAIMGAYGAIYATNVLHLPIAIAVPVVVLAMAVFGYLLQRGVLNATLGDDVLRPLLVTFGFSIIVQNLLLEGFTADSRSLNIGSFGTSSMSLGGGVAAGLLPLTIMVVAIVVLLSMQWLFSKTTMGRAFRAASDDSEVVRLMGVNNRHVYAIAMAISMGLVAVAGILYALQTNVGPTSGPEMLLYAFESVIIGGLGSLWGTLLGGVVLGIAQAIGSKLNPGWGILAGHLCFMLVLIVKPNGFFPTTRER